MNFVFFALRKFSIPAYKIKGLGFGRLCELIRRISSKLCGEEALLITDFRGGLSFRCFLKEHMGGQIFFRGSYSGDQLDLVELLLKPNSTFIDVGANQGEFSISASAVVTDGQVISFEPVPKFHKKLLANIEINNFHNVKPMLLALGDQNGQLPIYDSSADFYDGTRHEGLPSLYASNTRNSILTSVEIRKLDDVVNELACKQIDLIKLDIEGAEWAALRGATNLLQKYRPTLILEIGQETCQAAGYEPEAFSQWIIDQGYRIEKIMGGGKTQTIRPKELGEFQNIVAYPI
jgi:FkbM family methyltransferase